MTIEVKTGAGYAPIETPLMKVSDDVVPYKRNGLYDSIVVDSTSLLGASPTWSHKWKLKFTLQGLKVDLALNHGVGGSGRLRGDNRVLWRMSGIGDNGAVTIFATLSLALEWTTYGPTATHCPVVINRRAKAGLQDTSWLVPWSELNKEVVTFEIVGSPDNADASGANIPTLKVNGIDYTADRTSVPKGAPITSFVHTKTVFGGAIINADGSVTSNWALPWDAIYDEEFTAPDGTVSSGFLNGVMGALPNNLSTLSPWQPAKRVFRKEQSGWETGSRAYLKSFDTTGTNYSAMYFPFPQGNFHCNFNVEFKIKGCHPILPSDSTGYANIFDFQLRKTDDTGGYFWLAQYYPFTELFRIIKHSPQGDLRVIYSFTVPTADLQGDVTIRVENGIAIDPRDPPKLFINGNEYLSYQADEDTDPPSMENKDYPYSAIRFTPLEKRNDSQGPRELAGLGHDAIYDVKFERTDSNTGVPTGEVVFYPMDDTSLNLTAYNEDGEILHVGVGFLESSLMGGEWFYD